MIRKLISLTRRYRVSQTGVIAIEFAFIFPVMVLMYFGMLDLIQFVTVNRRVAAASGAVADLVTANDKTITSAQVTDYYNAAYMNLKPVPQANIRVEVFNYRSVSGAPVQQWTRNNGGGANCGAAPATSSFASLMSEGNDLVVTRVCTAYTPFFGRFMGDTLLGSSSITLVKTIYQRPRLNLQLNIS